MGNQGARIVTASAVPRCFGCYNRQFGSKPAENESSGSPTIPGAAPSELGCFLMIEPSFGWERPHTISRAQKTKK